MKKIIDPSWLNSQQNAAWEIAQEKLDNAEKYQYFCWNPEWQEWDYEYWKILVYIPTENRGYLIDLDWNTDDTYYFNQTILEESWRKITKEEFEKFLNNLEKVIGEVWEEVNDLLEKK